ncbi:MAG: ABC transporter permease, partial [Limimaricola sp.]
MIRFLLSRFVTMLATALALTFVVFFLTNLEPSLEKVAKSQIGSRVSDAEVESWLNRNGYGEPMLVRYGEWLGVVPGWTHSVDGEVVAGRCASADGGVDAGARCGILQGDWGYSTVFRRDVIEIVGRSLALTAKLMFWVMMVMVPGALTLGVLAGMREGSKLDRSLSTASILTTATPEYVSGVVFIAVFASTAVGLKWFNGSATSAMENATIENFTLPVLTIALYGMGYIARMTRA